MKTNNQVGIARTSRWVLGATALLWLGAAHAAGELELRNSVYQEVQVQTEDGRTETRQAPATRVVPGTEVIYVIDYGNVGDGPVQNVAITNPVPEQLVYVAPDGPVPVSEVSIDGGATYGDLSEFTVPVPDADPRPAEPRDVTHLRWIVPELPPGGEGAVSFRARVK